MKKNILIFLISLILFGSLIICLIKVSNKDNDENKDGKHIKMAEVTHSIFYAPLYVAIENGYFKEEGIDLEVILTPGADKVSSAVLSNSVDIGFAGIESAVYVYSGGEEDYLVNFAGLTKRDGQFIVSRECNNNFSLDDLYGKEILVGRVGGMPVLNFENAMKRANIDLKKINVNYSVDFANLSGTFMSGVGDYVNLFEPTATALEKTGLGCIVASIGELSGEVPYTTFYVRKSYLQKNQELLKHFQKAINKGLEFVKNNDAKTVANIILPQFPDSSLNDIEIMVNNYKKYDSWLDNTFISESSFDNLQNMLINNNLLKEKTPYNKLIDNLNE